MNNGVKELAAILTLSGFSMAGGVSLAAEFEVVDKFTVDGYSLLRGSADIQGDSFTVGTSTFVVQYGNVGIGTTNPLTRLHVAGSGATRLRIENTTGAENVYLELKQITGTYQNGINATAIYWDDTASRPYIWYQNGAERLRMDGSGNVGIGYADPGTAKLAINGNVGIGTTGPSWPLTVNAYGDIARFTNASGSNIDIAFGTGNYYGYIDVTNHNPGTTGFPLVLNKTGGNVGIGTSSPGAKLHVAGALYAAGEAGRVQMWECAAGGGCFAINNSAGTRVVQIRGDTNENNYFNNGGNVGIGTAGSGAKLQIGVTGVSNATVINEVSDFGGNIIGLGGLANIGDRTGIFIGADGGIGAGIEMGRQGSGWGSYLAFYTNNITSGPEGPDAIQEKVRIDQNGNVGIGTANPGGGSSSNILSIANTGISPTANTGMTHLYSSGGEGFWMDGMGNITLQTPHNPETGEWIFLSQNVNTDGILRVEMERLTRKLDKMLGGGYVIDDNEIKLEGYAFNIVDSLNDSLLFTGDNGDVGIGTTSPGAKLAVAGDVYANNAGGGVIVKSPDGTKCARIGISDTSAETFTVIACP